MNYKMLFTNEDVVTELKNKKKLIVRLIYGNSDTEVSCFFPVKHINFRSDKHDVFQVETGLVLFNLQDPSQINGYSIGYFICNSFERFELFNLSTKSLEDLYNSNYKWQEIKIFSHL